MKTRTYQTMQYNLFTPVSLLVQILSVLLIQKSKANKGAVDLMNF